MNVNRYMSDFDEFLDPYADLQPYMGPVHPSVGLGMNVKLGHYVVIEEDCEIGYDSFIGNFVVMRPGVILGDNCMVGHGTVFEGDCIVGNRVLIHAQCHITKHVVIENDVFIGPHVTTVNTRRIKHGRNFPLETDGPNIKRAARIGAHTLLMPGITIDENALIGAGSVVTKDVPAREVWLGTPAKKVGDVPQSEWL